MDDTDLDLRPAPPRSLTWRAVLIGLGLVGLVAVVTPVNDWYLRNTYFYSQHLPIGLFLLVVLAGTVVNPLLGHRRLRAGELMVIVAMLLALGGVVSSGLNRIFTTTMAGPARKLAGGGELAPYVQEDGTLSLPHGAYIGLESGRTPDRADPEFRHQVDGFWGGLATSDPGVAHRTVVTWQDPEGVVHRQRAMESGATADDLDLTVPPGLELMGRRAGTLVDLELGEAKVLEVEAAPIPWVVWYRAFLAWIPMIGSALVCFLAIGALVRRQWLHHERLPYPIAGVIGDFLEEPEPGRRLAPIFRKRVFWVAFSIAAVVLLSNGLAAFGLNPFPVPTTLDLTQAFAGDPWNRVWNHGQLFTWRVYFSIIAVTFLLPPDLGFSLWAGWVLTNIVPAFLRTAGAQVDFQDPSRVAVGGYAMMCLLILWIGRTFYLRVLATAFRLRKDPALREEAIYAWALILGLVALVVTMVAYGSRLHHALIAAAVYLGTGLVLARIIAEAGIPYLNSPTWWTSGPVIYSLTGFGVPIGALVPLGMLAQTLCADPREHILGFAVNAEALGDRAGAPRLRFTGILLLVTAIGTVVAGITMLVISYRYEAMAGIDGFWNSALMSGLGPPASAASGGDPMGGSRTFWCYGIGAVLTAGLGLARLAFSWWPFHPIGLLIAPGWATSMIWFSFFLGWLAKWGVMRYGGTALYRHLRPAALGLIAGEAAMVGIFLLIGLVAGLLGTQLPVIPKFLPW